MTRVICPEILLTRQQVASAIPGVTHEAVRPRAGLRRRPVGESFLRSRRIWPQWVQLVAERRRVRAAVREQLALEAGERVLRIICDDSGAWLVSTQRALYHQTDSRWSRIGWEPILRISSGDERHAVVLVTAAPEGPLTTTLRVTSPGPLLDLARERVASTVLLSTRISLGDHGSALITARRPPGSDKTAWQVCLDGHVDRADPEVEARIKAGIEQLHRHLDA